MRFDGARTRSTPKGTVVRFALSAGGQPHLAEVILYSQTKRSVALHEKQTYIFVIGTVCRFATLEPRSDRLCSLNSILK